MGRSKTEAADTLALRIRAILEEFYDVRGDVTTYEGSLQMRRVIESVIREETDPLPTATGALIIATFDCAGTTYTDKVLRRQKNGVWSTLDEMQFLAGEGLLEITSWRPAHVVPEEG